MNLKKKILLGVGLVLLLVFIGVPAYLMFRGISQFGSAKDELGGEVTRLRSFYQKNPFPTKGNIEKEKENLADMQKWFGQLVDVVTAGQVEKRDATPSSFITQYGDMRNRVGKLANPTKNIEVLAQDNALGFNRYAEGILPVAVDVPRLMQQMMITERLATILIEGSVKKINMITREEFDSVSEKSGTATKRPTSSRRGSSSRRGASAAKEQPGTGQKSIRKTDVYEFQSFTLGFEAKEGVILDVLNRLARDDLFIVITGVEFTKMADDLKMPQLDAGSTASSTDGDFGVIAVKAGSNGSDSEVRERRRVSGPNVDMPMKVLVDLDVYTFFVQKAKALKETSN